MALMGGFSASIHLQHPDGSVERVSPESGVFYQASIARDADRVVYFGATSGFPRLWSHSIETAKPATPLTPADSGARHPSFDWSGDRLAFSSDRHSPVPGETVEQINPTTRHVMAGVQMHIFMCNGDGSDVIRLTEGPYLDHRPSFSPDGRWVAFASNRSGAAGIWRVPVDGSSDPVPVLTSMWAYRPWFTSDGATILAYGPDGDRHRIWKIGIDTGSLVPLESDDVGITHGPFVQPGRGGQVLAHSTRGGTWGLWEFPLEGSSTPVCITPEGVAVAAHGTRAADGTLAFDVVTPHGDSSR
jgi:dipeptidyl aminopeptidase/acylaminoacyl peptidase